MKIDLKGLMDERLQDLDFTMDNMRFPAPETAQVIDVQKERKVRTIAMRRPMAGLVAACLCVVIAMSTLAASVPEMGEFFSGMISPDYQQYLEPVELFCDNNGIRMEVVSAVSDGENTLVMLAFQDLEQDRISDVIAPTFQALTHVSEQPKIVDAAYDEASKTAMVLLQYGNASDDSGEINIRIKNLASNTVVEFEPFDTGIDLSAVTDAPATIAWPTAHPSFQLEQASKKTQRELAVEETVELLAFENQKIELPGIDFATISNIGYINGQLHVQLCYTRRHVLDEKALDFGSFYVLAADSEEALSAQSIDPKLLYAAAIAVDTDYRQVDAAQIVVPETTDAQDNTRAPMPLYVEYVFDYAPQEGLHHTLMGISFRKDESVSIEGDWQLSFPVKTDASIIKEEVEIPADDSVITKFTVSPMTLKLQGKGTLGDTEIEIVFQDGSRITYRNDATCDTLSGMSSYYDFSSNTTYLEFIPKQPIAVDAIACITINGVDIDYVVA